MTGPWHVDFDDAYAVWLRRHNPTTDEELELILWIGGREFHGPLVDPSPGQNSEDVLRLGTHVHYRAFPMSPPDDDVMGGYLLITRIA